MIQNFDYASELKHQCSVCYEPVTNPICPSCIIFQIEAWLTSYPNYHELKNKLFPRLRKFLKANKRESTICIRCGNNTSSVCPYCFTEFVLDELKSMDVNKLILKEFLMFFNFDFGHKGYFTKEAEKAGVL